MTFTLTSKDKQYKKLFKDGTPVEIANPMSENIAIFREFIFPEHLELLSKNQHITYPQNLYEVGQILETDKKQVLKKTILQ
jgi:phenylalanyl-tRNA synthetase beta subunit